jgi:hypothetical protein
MRLGAVVQMRVLRPTTSSTWQAMLDEQPSGSTTTTRQQCLRPSHLFKLFPGHDPCNRP